MGLITPEKLKERFEKLKADKQRQKERQRKLKAKKYREYYKTLGLPKEQPKKEPEKKKTKIITLNDLPNHTLTTEFTIYKNNSVERYTAEEDLYTLYELQHIEELYPEEQGRINWDVWNKLIEESRKWNEEHFKN